MKKILIPFLFLCYQCMGQNQSISDGAYIYDNPQIDSANVKITDENGSSFLQIYFHTVPSLSKKEYAQIQISGQGKSSSGTLEVITGKDFTYIAPMLEIWPRGEYTLTVRFRGQNYVKVFRL